MFHLPNRVTIIEVGPRDGLQNTKHSIPTNQILKFIQQLQNAGIQEMEIIVCEAITRLQPFLKEEIISAQYKLYRQS